LWKLSAVYVPNHDKKNNVREMTDLFTERLDLYSQGICEITICSEHYPIHKAVFENNLVAIRRINTGER